MGYHSTQNQSVQPKAKVSHIRKTDGSLYPPETQIPASIKVSNQIKLKQPSRFFCQNQDAENIPGSSAVNSQKAKAFQTSGLCGASQSHTYAGTGKVTHIKQESENLPWRPANKEPQDKTVELLMASVCDWFPQSLAGRLMGQVC